MARAQRLSMKPSRKRSREGGAEQHDGDGDDALDEQGELYPPVQYFLPTLMTADCWRS
jgi:hypothetical protein